MAHAVALVALATATAGSAAAAGAPTVHTTNGTIVGMLKYGVAGFLGIPFAAPPIGALRFKAPVSHPGWTGALDTTVGGPKCVQGAGGSSPSPSPPSPPSPPHPAPPGCDAWCSSHGHAADECHCGVCGSFGHCTFSCTADNKTRFECPGSRAPQTDVVVGRGGGSRTVSASSGSSGNESCLYINAFTPSAALNRAPGDPLLPVMFYIHGGGFVGGSATTEGFNLSALTGHVVFAPQYR